MKEKLLLKKDEKGERKLMRKKNQKVKVNKMEKLEEMRDKEGREEKIRIVIKGKKYSMD